MKKTNEYHLARIVLVSVLVCLLYVLIVLVWPSCLSHIAVFAVHVACSSVYLFGLGEISSAMLFPHL